MPKITVEVSLKELREKAEQAKAEGHGVTVDAHLLLSLLNVVDAYERVEAVIKAAVDGAPTAALRRHLPDKK